MSAKMTFLVQKWRDALTFISLPGIPQVRADWISLKSNKQTNK